MTGATDASSPGLFSRRRCRCFRVELADEEAGAFAQWLKRAGFTQYRQLAIDDDEAYRMQAAAEQFRVALAVAGFAPR
jgi:hypothetical protein